MSASTILTQIDNAIASILTSGQEVVVNDQRYTKVNLEQLRKLRIDFAAMVNADNRTSMLDRALAGTSPTVFFNFSNQLDNNVSPSGFS